MPPAAAGPVPRTAAELAQLEASYQPFHGARAWRGVHVDRPRWDRYAHVLADRIRSSGETRWTDIQDLLLRAAALDSTALDGLFPANPELTTLVLSGSVAQPSSTAEAAEPIDLVAECHRRALVLAAEAAVAERGVDPNFIAVLQDVITEAQASYTVTTEGGENVEVELPRRQYKPVSNYLLLPGGQLAVFAPAAQVPAEMARLSNELASDHFATLHPAVQAAYAHYALTAIHPFADGNGRLARVIASIFLLRSVGVPLLVFADQWPGYYQALGYHSLGAAHRPADRQLLADYLGAAAITAMDLASNLLSRPVRLPLRASAPSVAWAAAGATAGAQAGPPRGALEAAALELLDTLCLEVRLALASPPPGVRIAIAATRALPPGHREPAYRPASSQGLGRCGVRIAIRAAAAPPASPDPARSDPASPDPASPGPASSEPVAVDLEFVALVSEIADDMFPVALRETGSNELLEIALGDAYPLISESAGLRVALWAQRLLAQAMAPILTADGSGPASP